MEDSRILFEGQVFTVKALVGRGGRCRVEDFLAGKTGLPVVDQRRLWVLVQRIGDFGIISNPRQSRTLGHSLFELKSPGGGRIIYFFDAGSLILCTHGFVKKSAKTPVKEITRALEARMEYLGGKTHE